MPPPAADLLRAALAAASGAHPAADTLRQYAAGTLAPAGQHRVEAHALACEQCADVLDGLTQTDAATTDHALAALRSRLHARVAQEAAPRPAAWHWPRLAAAAVVAAGLVGSGLWQWQHRPLTTAAVATVAQAPAPRPAVRPANAPVSAPPPAQLSVAAAPPAAKAPAGAPRPAPRPAPASRRATRHEVAFNRAAPRAQVATEPAQIAAAPATKADTIARPPVAIAATSTSSLDQQVLMSRTAGVATTTSATAAAPMARRMALAVPANSAVVGAMPAAPAVAPMPVGGLGALREQLRRQAAEFVPEEEAPRSGSVRVRFVVGDDGKISNLKVVRGLRADYDAEALRLLCEGPAWVPGVAGGRRTALPVELDVVF